MSDVAYDISYLLDSEPARIELPPPRVAKAVPAAPAPDLAQVQAAMARELLQAADAHEEWIRQYLSVHGAAAGAAGNG
ncbi:MAG: hypothetical protein ACYC0F_07705 [Rhodanobacter sp.]